MIRRGPRVAAERHQNHGAAANRYLTLCMKNPELEHRLYRNNRDQVWVVASYTRVLVAEGDTA